MGNCSAKDGPPAEVERPTKVASQLSCNSRDADGDAPATLWVLSHGDFRLTDRYALRTSKSLSLNKPSGYAEWSSADGKTLYYRHADNCSSPGRASSAGRSTSDGSDEGASGTAKPIAAGAVGALFSDHDSCENAGGSDSTRQPARLGCWVLEADGKRYSVPCAPFPDTLPSSVKWEQVGAQSRPGSPGPAPRDIFSTLSPHAPVTISAAPPRAWSGIRVTLLGCPEDDDRNAECLLAAASGIVSAVVGRGDAGGCCEVSEAGALPGFSQKSAAFPKSRSVAAKTYVVTASVPSSHDAQAVARHLATTLAQSGRLERGLVLSSVVLEGAQRYRQLCRKYSDVTLWSTYARLERQVAFWRFFTWLMWTQRNRQMAAQRRKNERAADGLRSVIERSHAADAYRRWTLFVCNKVGEPQRFLLGVCPVDQDPAASSVLSANYFDFCGSGYSGIPDQPFSPLTIDTCDTTGRLPLEAVLAMQSSCETPKTPFSIGCVLDYERPKCEVWEMVTERTWPTCPESVAFGEFSALADEAVRKRLGFLPPKTPSREMTSQLLGGADRALVQFVEARITQHLNSATKKKYTAPLGTFYKDPKVAALQKWLVAPILESSLVAAHSAALPSLKVDVELDSPTWQTAHGKFDFLLRDAQGVGMVPILHCTSPAFSSIIPKLWAQVAVVHQQLPTRAINKDVTYGVATSGSRWVFVSLTSSKERRTREFNWFVDSHHIVSALLHIFAQESLRKGISSP
ncbi:hypothetical protein DIPPA_24354 [Diplonema papillatum]|nr:hypothetical protein DIPPA_24354 [Diplonema papillatum]